MRNVMILAGLLIGVGTVMAQMADRMTPTPALAAATQENAVVRSADPRSIIISSDRRGHFQTEARIEGQRIGVMVDTGASVVALNETSAARIGVRPARNEFKASVTTANGTIKAARTRLAMVQVGDLVVRDVDAMILPDEALSQNLLGLSFLSKLKRFEFANGRMVLEQ
jgi:aspartyl protease family protein